MKRAALILARGFEESEALSMADILRRADLICELTGLKEEIVEGAHGIPVKCDRLLGPDAADYDMILLPGGYGAVDEMCESRELLEILQKMNRNGKFITALCAAPAVLAKAGILEGKSYTAYTGYGEKISQGTYVKKPVVTDGNLITGMGPAMAYAVAFRAVQALGGDARAVKDRMLYDHSFQEVDQ